MLCKKIVKCKVIGLTKIKRELIEEEHRNLQTFLQYQREGVDWLKFDNVYSANKQQALRFYKNVKLDQEYPISIRKDLMQEK